MFWYSLLCPTQDTGKSVTFLCTRDRTVVQAFSRWSVSGEFRIRSHASSCEVNGGPSGTGTGFTPSTSVLPCQYRSTNAPYSSSSTCFSYQITNVRRLGIFSKQEWSFGNRGTGVRKEISPYYIQCIGRTPLYVMLHLALCCGVILICYASVFLGDVEL